MNVLILHNAPAHDALADEQDVLHQVESVHEALRQCGHVCEIQACDLDLMAVHDRLRQRPPELVFNLVESLARTDRLAPIVPMLLDAMETPYTGTRTWPLVRACSKLLTKKRFCSAGLPSAPWYALSDEGPVAASFPPGSQVIVKPVWEHASFGMDDSSVFAFRSLDHLAEVLAERQRQTGRPWFAEQFIDGREFNVSLLAKSGDAASCEVFAPAEIRFLNFPAGRPRIVGHRAKWDGESDEYQQTPRSFEFPDSDLPLLKRLEELARDCWRVFELSGYARVDFRVGRDGEIVILEVNANPCLTPDAGLAAAALQTGLGYRDLVGRIVEAALPRPGRARQP